MALRHNDCCAVYELQVMKFERADSLNVAEGNGVAGAF
jgi:hypothetical protein